MVVNPDVDDLLKPKITGKYS